MGGLRPSTPHNEATRAGALVVAHDLARGVPRRVTYWEWLTGITDEEREKMRADELS